MTAWGKRADVDIRLQGDCSRMIAIESRCMEGRAHAVRPYEDKVSRYKGGGLRGRPAMTAWG